MSASEKKQRDTGRRFTKAAIGAVIAMLLSLALMLVAASLLADGKIDPSFSGKIVMICAFLGCFLSAMFTGAKQGRGVLTAAMLRCMMYLVLLLVLVAAAGTKDIFSAGFFKSAICSAVGFILAGTILAYRNEHKKIRRKHR